jgi:lipopolysaccharide transport system ATP-binding protein
LAYIGKNGAGKSTLLSSSRVLPPTIGPIEINGRIASLLEVGTDFTELTGRENVYLNGAILGMTRRRYDQSIRPDR